MFKYDFYVDIKLYCDIFAVTRNYLRGVRFPVGEIFFLIESFEIGLSFVCRDDDRFSDILYQPKIKKKV